MNLPRPKKEKKLPTVLSVDEVLRIFNELQYLKQKTILMLTYSSGLRVGEVVRLKLHVLDNERFVVHIRQGKGRKDRLTVLSRSAYEMICIYLEKKRPHTYAALTNRIVAGPTGLKPVRVGEYRTLCEIPECNNKNKKFKKCEVVYTWEPGDLEI
ncbi:tyrosine-type recombinase/integrase [Paenibacillus frigoriresistens]|uniref:tyrosine-type recombinase/integrase n=1 Tax=Paenibacillus alginolyticus TaxID=59839 RepID=UPI0015639E84|nr:tyrosine-type recombinase/integrase [Paenibacillus frigoriresistens]NRF90878.1 tyrosine-type recombinase/integrase [Paenibacillus frigoriresistens]